MHLFIRKSSENSLYCRVGKMKGKKSFSLYFKMQKKYFNDKISWQKRYLKIF